MFGLAPFLNRLSFADEKRIINRCTLEPNRKLVEKMLHRFRDDSNDCTIKVNCLLYEARRFNNNGIAEPIIYDSIMERYHSML